MLKIKQLSSLIITFIMSTTLVMAKSTEMDNLEQIQVTMEQISNMSSQEKHTLILKTLDREIEKAHKHEAPLEEKLVQVEKSINRLHKQMEKIQGNERKMKRYHKLLQKMVPEISYDQFVSTFEDNQSSSRLEENKQQILTQLKEAGSYSNFLKNVKNKLKSASDIDFTQILAIVTIVIISGLGIAAGIGIYLLMISLIAGPAGAVVGTILGATILLGVALFILTSIIFSVAEKNNNQIELEN